MAEFKKKNSHLWKREAYDWYVEPSVCSIALFKEVAFEGLIWDPSCGMGRIVHGANVCGLDSLGTDVVSRSSLCHRQNNYLDDNFRPEEEFNIVSNPPFGTSEEFVRKAIDQLGHRRKAAFLLPLVWMAGFSTKRDWLPGSPLKAIMPISPRPSMPPGDVILAGEKPGNGTKDFGWFIWEKGYCGKPIVEFLNTNLYKTIGIEADKDILNKACEHQAAA